MNPIEIVDFWKSMTNVLLLYRPSWQITLINPMDQTIVVQYIRRNYEAIPATKLRSARVESAKTGTAALHALYDRFEALSLWPAEGFRGLSTLSTSLDNKAVAQ